MIVSKDTILSEIQKNKYLIHKTIFKKTYPKNYEELERLYFPDTFKFPQRLYHYLYDLDLNYGLCKYCHKGICHFISFFQGYRYYCSNRCAQSDGITKEKIRQTTQDKYGVDFYNQSELAKQKMVDTCMKKYGVTNPAKYKEIKEKWENT